jgi:PAS domain-containing protein
LIKQSDFEIQDADISEQSLYEWRTKALTISLIVVAIASLPAYASVVINAVQNYQMTWREILYLAVYAGSIGLALLPKLNLSVRSWALMALTYTNAAASFARLGLVGSGRLWLIGMPVIAIIIMGTRAGYIMGGVSIATYIAFTILVKLGVLENWIILQTNPLTMGFWIEGGTAMVVFLATLVIVVERFGDLQKRAFENARQANITLAQTTRELRESEVRFRLFMDHFPGLAYIKDSSARVLFANRGFSKYLNIDI